MFMLDLVIRAVLVGAATWVLEVMIGRIFSIPWNSSLDWLIWFVIIGTLNYIFIYRWSVQQGKQKDSI